MELKSLTKALEAAKKAKGGEESPSARRMAAKAIREALRRDDDGADEELENALVTFLDSGGGE